MNSGISMIEALVDFVATMDELNIEYMVTGSYAMSAYGEIRMTKDIDVVVQMSAASVLPFFNALKDTYYVSDLSVRRAVDDRSMFNVVNHQFGGKIDCIVQKDTDFARASFARRYRETVAGVEFWNTTREDLIIAKLDWARESHSEMQIRDIANLIDAEYDAEYVVGWIDQLGLTGIWSEVEHWKIQHKKLEH